MSTRGAYSCVRKRRPACPTAPAASRHYPARAQRVHDCVVAIPTARGATGTSVDDEVLRAFARFRVQVVHQHAHGGFLSPILCRKAGCREEL